MLLHNTPLVVVLFVHFELNPVATVIGHIYVKKAVGSIRDHPEVEFADPFTSFDQFGKADILYKGEIHGVQFHRKEQAPCFIYLKKS